MWSPHWENLVHSDGTLQQIVNEIDEVKFGKIAKLRWNCACERIHNRVNALQIDAVSNFCWNASADTIPTKPKDIQGGHETNGSWDRAIRN